jgi:hypothetical protein
MALNLLFVVKSPRKLTFLLTTVCINFFQSKYYVNWENFFSAVPPDTRTVRSCAYEVGAYPNKCYQRSGFGGRHEVCACDGDLCNSATKTKAALGVILAVVVAFIASI